jgi:hypothetical protein
MLEPCFFRFTDEDEKSPRGGIVLQQQARRGEPFDQGLDCYPAIDESRQICRRLPFRDRGTRGDRGTRPPWDDRCTHDASSARSACFQMIPMSATMHVIEANQVIVATASMRESVPAQEFAQQCRSSWKRPADM